MMKCAKMLRVLYYTESRRLVDNSLRLYLRLRLLLIALLLVLPVSTVFCQSDEDAILKTFLNYQVAVFNENGDLAYEQIDSHTREYYRQILDKSRYASAVESKALSMTDKFLLIRSRHQLDIEELRRLNPKTYFQYAVEHGWIDKRSLSGLELTDIRVSNDQASTHFRKNGQIADYGFAFYREGTQWRIDLTSVFPYLEASLRSSAQRFEGGGDALILHIVGVTTHRPVDQLVWFPPLEAEIH